MATGSQRLSWAGGAILASALLAACSEREEPRDAQPDAAKPADSKLPETVAPAARWQLLASGEGTALRLAIGDKPLAMHLFCPAGSRRLLVNVPAFKPSASEERLSFGGRGEVVALVADVRGDARRGGVTGEGPVPVELAAILAGPISASYGAQAAGPHSAPALADRAAFLTACNEKRASPAVAMPASSACRMQDGTTLTATPLKALGTEPFWGAAIDGRCVTYSTPEDQNGTRIWTRFTAGSETIWSGALDGRPFELRTRPAPSPGCSDGMSDRRYALAVTLSVRGETRQGCADDSAVGRGEV